MDTPSSASSSRLRNLVAMQIDQEVQTLERLLRLLRNGLTSENLDEPSKACLKRLLDEATQKALGQREAKIIPAGSYHPVPSAMDWNYFSIRSTLNPPPTSPSPSIQRTSRERLYGLDPHSPPSSSRRQVRAAQQGPVCSSSNSSSTTTEMPNAGLRFSRSPLAQHDGMVNGKSSPHIADLRGMAHPRGGQYSSSPAGWQRSHDQATSLARRMGAEGPSSSWTRQRHLGMTEQAGRGVATTQRYSASSDEVARNLRTRPVPRRELPYWQRRREQDEGCSTSGGRPLISRPNHRIEPNSTYWSPTQHYTSPPVVVPRWGMARPPSNNSSSRHKERIAKGAGLLQRVAKTITAMVSLPRRRQQEGRTVDKKFHRQQEGRRRSDRQSGSGNPFKSMMRHLGAALFRRKKKRGGHMWSSKQKAHGMRVNKKMQWWNKLKMKKQPRRKLGYGKALKLLK